MSLEKMRIVVILALCVWSCQGVRGFSCLYPDLPDVLLEPNLDSYKDNSTAHYVCKKGKKNVLETCWGEIKCVNGAWSPLPECIDESSCIIPHVLHAKPEANLEHFYPTGAKVEFKCNKAYRFESDNPFASCENGQWDLPVCIRRQDICNPPAPVQNAVYKGQVKDLYEDGETVEFVCKPGFEMIAGETSTCWGTKWLSKPECIRKEPENHSHQPQPVSACGELPHVHNGTVSPQKNKMALVVSCNEFHRLVGPKTVRCTDGNWTKLPVCQPPCELDEHLVQYSNVKYLQEGEMKTLRCHFYPAYHRRVSCEKGEAQYSDCLRHKV